MTSPHLRPCPTCARHIRVSEAACPFCRASLAGVFAGDRPASSPAARLSRAALFALGAGAATVGAAVVTEGCGSSSSSPPSVGLPAYGLAPYFDAGESDDAGGSNDAGGTIDGGGHEGGDAGGADDAGSSHDAADDVGIAPPYGVSPTPPGHQDEPEER